MIKISEAKESQGYVNKAVPLTCVNCKNFIFNEVEKSFESFTGTISWTEEKNLRCFVGGFAVKKMATCDLFQKKVSE